MQQKILIFFILIFFAKNTTCSLLDFHEAILSSNYKKVTLYCQKHPQFIMQKNNDGNTAIGLAMFYKKNDIVTILVAHGAQITNPLYSGGEIEKTKLDEAISRGRKQRNPYEIQT